MKLTKSVAAALASTVCMVALATPAAAQAATYKIPAGNMKTALDAFVLQSGIEVVYRIDQLAGVHSPGVNGTMSPEIALQALLVGSGLEGKRDRSGALAVVPAKTSRSKISYRRPEVLAYSQVEQSAAEEASSARSGQLEEIVVTAQRRAENLQDVPIAVTAVTGDMMEVGGVNSSADLPKLVPGMVTYQLGTAFLPYIRGVGSDQAGGGNESPVAVYIDGVYQGVKAANIMDLTNIERLEVLKGPQGTLFGRNANGGAINVVTRDPRDYVEVNAEIGYGRFSEKRARTYVAGPITDTLGASLAFSGRWSDGYIRNIGLDERANKNKNIVAMGKLVWEPVDDLTVKLSGAYTKTSDSTFLAYHLTPGTRSVAQAQGFASTYDPREIVANYRPRITGRSYRGALDIRYDLGGVRLVSLTGYADALAYSGADQDVSMGDIIASDVGQPGKQFTQEFQLQSNDGGPLTWIVGAHYMWLKEGQGHPPDNLAVALNIPAPFRPADLSRPGARVTGTSSLSTTNAGAVFAQASYKFTPRTQLTLGLRYTKEKKAVKGRLFQYTAVPGAGGTGTDLMLGELGSDGLVFGTTTLAAMDLDKSWSKITWRIALDHEFTHDVMGYVSYNRGFKSGSFVTGNVNPNQAPVDPEVLDAFELGLKTQLFDRRLRFNVSAFYYDYKNIQVAFLTSQNVAALQNAAKARLYGIDVDFAARPTQNLTIRGGFNYLNSKYKNFERA